MEGSQIRTELGLGDVIERTFSLYMHNFLKYFAVFLTFQAIIGGLSVLVMFAFPLPTLPPNATSQQALNFLPGFLAILFLQLAVVVIVAWVFSSISTGTAIKFTSEVLQKGQADVRASLRYAVSKLLPILAVGLVTGIITFLGLLALVVPGIILAIMFSLSLPVLLIENTGVLDSLGRSRKLVGHRWLKTFGLLLFLGLFSIVVAVISSLTTALFGVFGTLVTELISAFFLPLFPIALTVYYYSNAARLTYPEPGTSWAGPAGYKFCQACGSPLPAFAAFCSNCGAKQTH